MTVIKQFTDPQIARIWSAVRAVEKHIGHLTRRHGYVVGSQPAAVRCCLAEQHPGYNIVFEVYVGTWNPATDNWDYSLEKSKAKDLFYADPEVTPGEGATGMFIPRPSDTYGTIYMAISGDCDAPEYYGY